MSESATKQCADCHRVLATTEFYWVSKASGTLRGQCKACMKMRKGEQLDPNWTPACSRCAQRLPVRGGSGRRLCPECFAQTYDMGDRRDNGAHRIRLKPCSLCYGVKERFERGKLCTACKPWASYAQNLRRFGITPAEYVAMLRLQGNACYVCGAAPGAKRLCIDHDHSIPDGREAVRGLLCAECNYSRLPRFAEDVAMLSRAVDYLASPPAHDVLRSGVAGSTDLRVA